MDTELKEKIEECERLYAKLAKRPFKIKASACIVDVNNHPKLTNLLIKKLKNKERVYAKVSFEGERIWCILIGRADSYNANFSKEETNIFGELNIIEEEGEIFVGVIDNVPISDKIKFNDLIQFQSCDVFEVQ